TVPFVRYSTHKIPGGILATPYVVVFLPDGRLTEYLTQDYLEDTWPVHLYLAVKGDMGLVIEKVYPHIDAWLTAFHTGRILGMPGYVQETRILDYQMDAMPDYDGRYIGIRWRIQTRIRNNIQRSST
ncbi:MAG TPA: hypothetical protein VKR24_12100, partial [Candidatus Limnocylindrales bacterium]|nr:hypothetical protein [Candidatus Limnocylindrales bacterium]